MNKKKLILGFILLGFITGLISGSFEVIKFTTFKENNVERNKVSFDSLTFGEKIFLGVYYLTLNTFWFVLLATLPLIPLLIFWNFYKCENSIKNLWQMIMIYWVLYSEIIYIKWGLPFLKHTRHYLSIREIVLNNVILFSCIAAVGLLSFHISFRIYNIFPKGDLFFVLINFIFLIISTIILRFYFAGYFQEYLPLAFRTKGFFLILFILFLIFSFLPVYYSRKSKSEFLLIPKLGKVSVFVFLFLSVLTCFGYYSENISIESEKFSGKALTDTSADKNHTNVILILIDTLRADHLSCYGYNEETSPNIDKLAEEGVLFTNSFSQTSWTKSSVASLFTSLYPAQHNACIFDDTLPEKAETIAEILKDNGFTTAGFVANPNVGKAFNFQQGFDLYLDDFIKDKIYYATLRNSFIGEILRSISRNRFFPQDRANADVLNSLILPWLSSNKDKKFFLYLHYRDPHSPYNPPDFFYRKYINKIDPNVYKGNDKFDINMTEMALYDGEIEFNDLEIGELLKTVEKLNIAKNTLIILLSDHGEAFLEHGNKEHGFSLYHEEIIVPLIMKLPGYIPSKMRIPYRVCTIDIMPTILDILNIKYKGTMEGKSLVPVIKNPEQQREKRNYIFFEERYLMGKPIITSLMEGDNKYIFTKVFKDDMFDPSKVDQLFDLKKDPMEFHNLAIQKAEVVKLIKEKMDLLEKHMKESAIPSIKTKVDEKTKDQIRALGYIQ